MKKFKYTKLLVSILLSVWITSWLVFAWNGLQATDWDTLTAAKWNELVTKVTGIETNTYTKTEIDNKWYLTSTTWWWVQLSSTCTTSTPWVMNYDSVNELMNICLWWEWQTFASAVKIWWDISKPWLSCKDILDKWWNIWDGIYWIKPTLTTSAIEVYCDMTNDWGGWTLVMVTGNWGSHSWLTTEQWPITAIRPTPLPATNVHYKMSDDMMNQIKGTTGEDIAIRMIESEKYNVKRFWKRSCTLWTSYADNNDSDCVYVTGVYSENPTYTNLSDTDSWKFYLWAINSWVDTSWKRLSVYGRNNYWFHYWRKGPTLWYSFWWTMWVR